MSADELYNLEGRNKYSLLLSQVERFSQVIATPTQLGHIVFPQPAMVLDQPRAMRLSSEEAQVRLTMHSEAMVKWGWPTEIKGADYLRRLAEVTRSATRTTPCWLVQWCSSHQLNRKLLAELVL